MSRQTASAATRQMSSEVRDLLSQILGQDVDSSSVSPMGIFMINLVQLLIGIAVADGQVTVDEKQHLKNILRRMHLLEGELENLTKLVVRGVKEHKTFRNLRNFLSLAEPLTKSQRLLLIGLGYEMSAIDGSIDPQEVNYLEKIATALEIEPSYLRIFEASFAQQENSEDLEATVLEEILYLLDPARFHDLDIVFTEAASNLVELLPKPAISSDVEEDHASGAYVDLVQFQENLNQLDQIYCAVAQVICECADKGYISETLVQDFDKIWERLRSQRFRIAVVGEFSQGKSTFLNALLGEKIQPTRATPCSGTLTVLRYGKQKRVICRYRDGREEEIPIELYHEKAAIPKEAAHGKASASQALLENTIEEIIFEHPDLELCKSGVEIVDSPGLNEHDDRTRVTQQLLKGTDAVIFLANAARPLTKWEQDFLTYDLRQQMRAVHAQEGNLSEADLQDDTPAENLFVLVNFMDLLDEESDREDVRERFHNFLLGSKPILCGDNRIHYISAKAVLKAYEKGEENEYTLTFEQFVQSVEQFLASERGILKLTRSVQDLEDILAVVSPQLELRKRSRNGEIHLLDQAVQEIRVRIRDLQSTQQALQNRAIELYSQASNDAIESWNQNQNKMVGQIVDQSQYWECGDISDSQQIARRYTECFVKTLSEEIDVWVKNSLTDIMKNRIEDLNQEIISNLAIIRSKFKDIDQQTGSNFSQQIDLSVLSNQKEKFSFAANFDVSDGDGWLAGLGIAGIAAGLLGILTGGFFIPVALMAFGGGLLGFLGGNDKKQQIRQEVIKKGFEKFDEAVPQLLEELDNRMRHAFQDRVDVAMQVLDNMVTSAQNLLNDAQEHYRESSDSGREEVDALEQKILDLAQANQQAHSVLRKQLLIEVNRDLSTNSQNAQAWIRKGEILAELEYYEEALASYERAIDLEPENTEAWAGKGDVLGYQKNFEDALLVYEKILSINPEHPDALANKGCILHELGKFEEACEVLDQAILLHSDDPRSHILYLLKADSLLELGRYQDAILACECLIELRPESSAAAWWIKGSALYFSDQPQEGLIAVETAIEIDPNAFMAWLTKGNIHTYAFEQYEEGLWAFERAIKLNSEDPRPWNGKGYCLAFLDQTDAAIEACEKAISLQPNFVDAWINIINIFRYLKEDLSKAISVCEQAIEQNPDNASLWKFKGSLLSEVEKYPEAILAYDQAININPQDASLFKDKGNILFRIESYQDAMRSYQQALQIDANYAPAWGGQGNVLMAERQYEEAINAYNQALEIDSTLVSALSNKGDALRHLGRYEEAFREYEKAIAIAPDNPAYWYNAACALLSLHSYELALEKCEQAIQLNSEIDAFWELRSDILCRLGRHDEAMR